MEEKLKDQESDVLKRDMVHIEGRRFTVSELCHRFETGLRVCGEPRVMSCVMAGPLERLSIWGFGGDGDGIVQESAEQERLVRYRRLASESLDGSVTSSEGPEAVDDDHPTSEEDDEGVVHHRRHSSLENFKLTAHSVAELRVYFELLSSRNQSAKAQGESSLQRICSWKAKKTKVKSVNCMLFTISSTSPPSSWC